MNIANKRCQIFAGENKSTRSVGVSYRPIWSFNLPIPY